MSRRSPTSRVALALAVGAVVVAPACGTGAAGSSDGEIDRAVQKMRTQLDRADVDLYRPMLRETRPVEVEVARNGDVRTTFLDLSGSGSLDRYTLTQSEVPDGDPCDQYGYDDPDCSFEDGVLRTTFEEMSTVAVVRDGTLLSASLVTEDDATLLEDAVTAFGDAERTDADALVDEITDDLEQAQDQQRREERADPLRKELGRVPFDLWLPDLRGASPSWTEVRDGVVVSEFQGNVFSFQLRQAPVPDADPCDGSAGWSDCTWDGATLTAQRGQQLLAGVVRDGTLLSVTGLDAEDGPVAGVGEEALAELRSAGPAKPADYAVGPPGGERERDARLAAQLEERGLVLFLPELPGVSLLGSSIDDTSSRQQVNVSFFPTADPALFPVRAERLFSLEEGPAPDEDPCLSYEQDTCTWDGQELRAVSVYEDDVDIDVGVLRDGTFLEVGGMDTEAQADEVLAALRAAPKVEPEDLAFS